ncbi:MAG: bifunctional transaldolase/phosoglucose isomerase [Candidatus Aminicenantes bacterium]|nr:bifunctional transaldolase/phosoglucose isomerase [Candidatus Aminicenantes bacterium]
MNPLKELQQYGQSFWLDYIRRSLIIGGELERLVKEDGLRGVTSNPTIFQKAIAGSSDYDDILKDIIEADPQMKDQTLYEKLAIEDIQLAADVLRGVYDETDGADGFVCLELSPSLAHETKGSIEEARRIWKEVQRPNLMVKVPATPEGIPVIESLIAEGINVNITLMFSLAHYEAVAQGYLRGLERCSDPHRVSSVASFFVSRVDKIVDKALEEVGTPEALDLRGKTAIANAKIVYKRFKELFRGEKWEKMKRRGARVQRPLWASTSTKNPAYPDILYVEELIGADTINTMPTATLNAFRDHGQLRSAIEEGVEEAEASLRRLASLGVDLEVITEKLQEEGVDSFAESFDSLLETLKHKRQTIIHALKDHQTLFLGEYKNKVEQRLKTWKKQSFSRRLWAKDPTLWFPEPKPEITDRLGWLELPEAMQERLGDFISLANQVKGESVSQVVLLGMGGSSLAPDVFQKTFGQAEGYPELVVLDSTHPSAVKSVEDKLDLNRTLFVVSSKSGTTLETLSLFRYFWKQMGQISEKPGPHFVAITDPSTPLMKLGLDRGFRRVFQANPDVGGRYSAFTDFGLVPAALIGMDIHRLLDMGWIAAENCSFCLAENKAAGLVLGAALGELARMRDKLTFVTSPALSSFPDWVEQLIAESTGKNGKGLVPVANEPFSPLDEYSQDRLFVFLCLEGDENEELEKRMKALREAGHPVVRHDLVEKFDLGKEIFGWEIAVASAGSTIGIHPFNQPDVQLAKDFTRRAMEEVGRNGGKDINEVEAFSINEPDILAKALKDWISQAQPGDYVALQAFLSPTQETTTALQNIRLEILKRTRLATTMGYGPRFLHSTGQLHKGGPNSGLFLQIVDEPKIELPVPETDFSFKRLIRAQSFGDYLALKQRGRRILRVDMKAEIGRGFEILEDLLQNQT